MALKGGWKSFARNGTGARNGGGGGGGRGCNEENGKFLKSL